MWRGRRGRAVGLVLAAVVLAALGLEGVVRLRVGDRFLLPASDEEDLKVLLRSGEALNSHGYRDAPRSLVRTEGLARIVVLGDSVTFGQGVSRKQAYPSVAESLLDGVEVLNFGHTGFDVQQIAALARLRVPAWDPDLIVYGFNPNDRVETELVLVGDAGLPLHVGVGLPTWLGWLRRHVVAVRVLLGGRAARRLAQAGIGGSVAQEAFFAPHAAALVEAVGDTPLLVLTLPHYRHAASDCAGWSGDAASCRGDEEALAQAVALFAVHGVPVVSTLPALTEVGPDALVLAGDPHHPNAQGHQLLGRVLATAVRAQLSPARSE